jgi:hypothetical protein
MAGEADIELSPEQCARLRRCDGLETQADTVLLGAPASDDLQRVDLLSVVRAVEAPGLVREVMGRIGHSGLPLSAAMSDAATQSPSMSDAVMGRLGLGQSVGEWVRSAIGAEAGEPPAIWDAIAESVGGQPAPPLSGALRRAVEGESAAAFSSMSWLAPRRRWRVLGGSMAIAAAAALVFYVGLSGGDVPLNKAAMLPILAAPVEIEELEVGDTSSAHILQFGAEAPTIILIGESTGVHE